MVSQKDLRSSDIKRLKNYKGHTPQNFVLENPLDNINDSENNPKKPILTRHKSSQNSIEAEQQSIISYAYAQSIKKKIKRNVNEIKELKTAKSRIQADHELAVLKKSQLMKRISDFRKLIANRLDDRKDPNSTMIMKCIDDSLIHDFLEKYKGKEMSIDTVIELMVESVGRNKSGALSFNVDDFFEEVGRKGV